MGITGPTEMEKRLSWQLQVEKLQNVRNSEKYEIY